MPESHATKSARKIFKTGSTLFFCFFSVSVTNFCWNRNEIYRMKHAETEQKRVTVAHCQNCWVIDTVILTSLPHARLQGRCPLVSIFQARGFAKCQNRKGGLSQAYLKIDSEPYLGLFRLVTLDTSNKSTLRVRCA